MVCDTVFGMIGFGWIFKQNARLQLGTIVLADPGQFEFGFICQFIPSDKRRTALTRIAKLGERVLLKFKWGAIARDPLIF